MIRVILPLPGNRPMAERLSHMLDCELQELEVRQFPDSETYLRYRSQPNGRFVVLVCTLDRPDAKILPLIFAARTARELGAASVGLVAPYLSYMRQDRQFHPGEAVTSAQFASLLSREFDWLVTIDPHLHRHHALEEVYSIPARALHAAPLLATWIAEAIENPLLIGPDEESRQWVSRVAEDAGAPCVVLEKQRRGDRDIEIAFPDLSTWTGRTPVLLDDIISSGWTMLEAVDHLRNSGFGSPVCIAVHGVFADASDQKLRQRGARVVTSNTIPHPTNAIDVTDLIAKGLSDLSFSGSV
jgi:ribose-phosphate pyrophosphokinase